MGEMTGKYTFIKDCKSIPNIYVVQKIKPSPPTTQKDEQVGRPFILTTTSADLTTYID